MDNPPLFYYRTWQQIVDYRKIPAAQKLRQIEMQMEFLYYAMPEKAKRIRDRFKGIR
jgi:hypothetical protein